MKVSGLIVKCTVKVHTPSPTRVSMLVNGRMMKRMATVSLHTAMVRNSLAIGRTTKPVCLIFFFYFSHVSLITFLSLYLNLGGKGTLVYPSGDKYTGDWLNAKKHGIGELHNVNGDVYNGEWKDDHAEGQGTLVFANGNRYDGEFKRDLVWFLLFL